LHFVKSLPKPQKVPPPTFVPLTLSNFPSPSTYISSRQKLTRNGDTEHYDKITIKKF
jgi:hypothetical protein